MEKMKPIYQTDSNKVGSFNILFEKEPDTELMQALMDLCTVIHAFPHESGRGTTYVAISDLFEGIEDGEEVPQYRIEFRAPDQKFDRPDYEVRRLNSRRFGFVAIRNTIIRVPPLQISQRFH